MTSYDFEIEKLRSTVNGQGTSVRADDLLFNKSIYLILSSVDCAVSSATEKSFSNDSMSLLEDICNGKLFTLTKSLQVLIISVYTKIVIKAPGYVVRNVLNSMFSICNNKNSNLIARDCAVCIIGSVMEHKGNDCGSQINEAVVCVGKLIKTSDINIRISVIKTLVCVVIGSGSKIGDLHLEIIKLVSKLSSDKIPDVRLYIAILIRHVAKNSLGCTTVSSEVLLAPTIKGLEDEVAIVQDAYAEALASIFVEQINVYIAAQEQAKHGAARGGENKSAKVKAPVSRMSMVRLSSVKKVVEEFDFRTVLDHLFKQILKSGSNTASRAGYVAALGHLIKECLNQLSQEDFEWLTSSLIGVLHDPSLQQSLSYEEGSFLRTRFSFLIRSAITSNLTEPKLISFGSQLASFVSNMDASNKTDLEMQLALSELSHVVTVLGAAAVSILDEVSASATVHLRHSSFGVRSAAAHVLSSLSVVAPVVAVDLLRNALTNTRAQSKLLLVFDGSESGPDLDESEGGSESSGGAQQSVSAKKRSPKEAERLQRMFYFHGHTLVISILLKNAQHLPSGLPLPLVAEIYELGVELLQHDVFAAPAAMRHVSCSVVRAGSLIVSSCLSLGFGVAKLQLTPLLRCCSSIFQLANCAPASSPVGETGKVDDLIYEIMSVEAALVCLSTLLLFCPEALSLEQGCLNTVVEGLETAFRALKSKYQPRYRDHFRFRTLHVILMECFAWLPVGSYPNSCQQVFVEALRVFRDSIQAGYDCTGVSEFIPKDLSVLAVGGVASYRNAALSSGAVPCEISISEHTLMLRLESNATALQKKESEAFLAAFGKDNYPSFSLTQQPAGGELESVLPVTVPCAHIDSRTIDSSILLLATTFALQSGEYQDKAVQLCAQAVSQFAKPAPKSLFSSEEEKRRRDRKNYFTVRNVVAAISAIVRAFPTLTAGEASECPWSQALADLLYDLVGQPYYSIRCASAAALSNFAFKFKGGDNCALMTSVSYRIRSAMISSLAKKGETMEGFSGQLLALSALWTAARDAPDVRSVLITTVFDCLRKSDSVVAFKAHGLLALSVVVKGFLALDEEEQAFAAEESRDVAEKTITLVETSLANLSATDDLDLFLVCLLRLINTTVALALKLRLAQSEVERLLVLWRQMPSFTANPFVLNEALGIFSLAALHDQAGVLNEFLFSSFLCAVADRKTHSIKALAGAVEGIHSMVAKAPQQACAAGVDSALFLLLDYSLASTTVSTLAPYAGVEIRRGVFQEEFQSDDVKRLMCSTMQAIYTLVEADVRRDCDTRLAYWILLCRAIALNLRSIGGPPSDSAGAATDSGDGDDRDQQEEDEGGFDQPAPGGDNKLGETADILTHIEFTAHCRETALSLAPDLKYCRVQIKCVAVRCIQIGLSLLDSRSLHSDLGLARLQTNKKLSQLSSAGDEQLSAVSKPVALFLTDLVNLTCACATFTIDDKPILLLQRESLQVLRSVVTLFVNATDPDIAATLLAAPSDSSSSAENKILAQFLSQILSTVKLCLSVVHCPELLHSAGSVLCDLIRGGFVADKVIARRLLKPLFVLFEQQQPESSQGSTTRHRESSEVSEAVAVADYVGVCGMLAQLSQLTSTSPANYFVGETVKATIASMLNEHAEALAAAWRSISLDALRMCGAISISEGDDSAALDALRGGLTYHHSVKVSEIAVHYLKVLPATIAAYCSNKLFKADDAVTLFAACVAAAPVVEPSHHEESQNWLGALVNLATKDVSNTIPMQEWLGPTSHCVDLLYARPTVAEIERLSALVDVLLDKLKSAVVSDSTVAGDPAYLQLQRTLSKLAFLAVKRVFAGSTATDCDTSSSRDSLLMDLSAPVPKLDPLLLVSAPNQPIPLLTLLSNFERCSLSDATSAPHSVRLLSSILIQLSALSSPNSAHLKVFTAAVSVCIASIATLTATISVVPVKQYVAVMFLRDLSSWCGSAAADMSLEALTSTVDNLLRAWRAVAMSLPNLHSIPTPVELELLVLSEHGITAKAAVQALMVHIQTFLLDTGGVVAEALLPAFLCRLNYPQCNAELRVLLVKALLLLVSVAPDQRSKDRLVELLVTPLCDQVCAHSSDAAFSSLSGKGFVHLARLCPEAFRGSVALLSDVHRSVLQKVMTQAMQQGEAGTAQQSGVQMGGAAPSGMKINLNKFKTAN